jgi:antitoxin MazE
MKIAFQKWGNSLAVRVPKVVAQEIGAREGRSAEMSVQGGKLVIAPIATKRRAPRYSLDQLVGRITPQNRHDEIDWGTGVGNEAW